METCPNCNKIILSDYKFCPRCGFSLYGEPAAGSENGIIIQNPNQESATLFFELAKNLGEATNIDLLLKKIGNAIEKILNAERSSTLLLDETEKFLFFKVASGDSALQKLRIPLNKGSAGWIATNRKGVIVNDPYSDKRFSSETDKTTGFKTTSIVGVPLLIGNTLIGVCEAINKKSGGFTEEDLQILTGFAGLAAVSIANLKLKTDQKNLYSNLFEFLAMAAESLSSPEPTPKGHTWEMARLAPRMAKELGMSTSKQQLLQQAALIHDIGFLGLDHPKLIGLNIKDNLNDLARYKLHPIVGSEMIKGIKFMQKLAPIIAVHHRYRNGEGFPENLPIEQISPESEIISILEDYLEKGSIDKIKTERYSESSLQALKNIISR